MTAWFSLRRRLLLLLLGGVSVFWLATLVTSYIDAHHEIDELFDAQLAQTAQALLAQRHQAYASRHDSDEEEEGDDDDDKAQRHKDKGHPYQSKLLFQIWHADGSLVLRSAKAPATPMTTAEGFSESSGDAGRWRFFSQWDNAQRHRVVVAENHKVRDELVRHIAWRLLLPALLGLPLLGAWVWLATRRGLAPLDAVAGDIAAREPGRLHPLAPARAPDEIRPLIEAINQLFGRVEQTLEAERRFTADAAHELRTPLAALATQAQVALRARDDAERQHAIEQLSASVRRASRLVDQLLTLARLDPEAANALPTVALDELAQEACADHGPAALGKDIRLELEATPVTIRGEANWLRILLRNLLDNAIRYTPAGGRVVVAITQAGGDIRLSVCDNGPGVPAAERQRVFDRFHRLAGQDIEGSGLGLSIVARIAERHGATVSLDAGIDGRGLCVALSFPPRPR